MTEHPTRPRARRFVELFVIPALILLAFSAPVRLWRDRLPDPMASHWGPSGAADGAMSADAALLTISLVWLGLWLLLLAILQSRRVGGTDARRLVATIYWAGAVLLGAWLLGVAANLDVPDWRQADDIGGVLILGAMVAGLPLAGLGWWLAAGRPEADTPRGVEAVPLVTAEGHTAVWVGQATNGVLVVLAVALAVALGVLRAVTDQGGPALAGSIAVPVVVLLLAARVRLAVGPTGARITMGWLGWPSRTVTYDQMASIQVEDVVPMAYGGWGFRLAKGTQAHVVRAGEGIRIVRKGRSDVLVTVDDAATGASVLAGHFRGGRAE